MIAIGKFYKQCECVCIVVRLSMYGCPGMNAWQESENRMVVVLEGSAVLAGD